jgi:hypothetical protein
MLGPVIAAGTWNWNRIARHDFELEFSRILNFDVCGVSP